MDLTMKNSLLVVLIGVLLGTAQASAQQKTVTGRVTNEQGEPLADVSVTVRGAGTSATTNSDGNYSIAVDIGQVLEFELIGTNPEERTVGAEDVINVELQWAPFNLDAVVVTALGQTARQRALGTAQQTVRGTDIAQTQRPNFVNALQGRVAGVEVTSSSGVPGASSQITIRGVSSISSSNQPLMIIDGLPMDNKTINSESLAGDYPGSGTAYSNRGVDFSNRAIDVNPEDIETMVVLKGPEAAALYGIDAANGAIVITTKRGRPGFGGLEYSNSFGFHITREVPEVQHVYSLTDVGGEGFRYFGVPYPAGTQFYDNIDGFFRRSLSQKHNLAFSGAAPDGRISYRLATSLTKQEGIVPGSQLGRVNVTGRSVAQVSPWLTADLSMQYSYYNNDQPWKGAGGPLLGLLAWPATDDAKNYLTPAGTRRRLTDLSADDEIDNPYFNVLNNQNNSKRNRIIANFGLTLTPFSWASLKTNIGTDWSTDQLLLLRHPESALGFDESGIIDQNNDVTRNINAQTILTFNPIALTDDISIRGFVGNQINDYKSTIDGFVGQDFLDPNFVSINNTNLNRPRTTISQRRLIGLYGQATIDYKNWWYLNITGRNDWTSTIPKERNSFFYPSVSTSLVFSDAIPSIGRFMTGKLRAAYAEVGKDARPYAYRPALESKTTAYGGYGFAFWGPNLNLKPEFARSYEFGTELSFLNDRLGLDVTLWRKQTRDQIVQNIRGSYATGFILFNLNGGVTRNEGIEVTLRGTPVQAPDFTWDFLANFDKKRGKVLSLPNELPEFYLSDTWLYGNLRNGTAPGLSTRSITGRFYERNDNGDVLIDPATGLPIRSSDFIDGGYDREADFKIGLSNTFTYKRFSLSFLVDVRKGGDIFNATEHYLTARGLSMRTLDRWEPRVIEGVLRDGKQNTDNPTVNTIVVTPALQTDYYEGISEELFIEKDINWLRLRDVTLRYALPERWRLGDTSVFLTATDLFLVTNYSGLDPIVNGNTAAVGGSGAVGVDYGNFPMPIGINFGIRTSF